MIVGGKSLVSSVPVFSNDAKKLLVCTGNTVSIFSTYTGLQVTELRGHRAPVTSVIVVPVAAPASKILCNCWTSSLDASICFWDFYSSELIRKVDIKLPIFFMIIPRLSARPHRTDEDPPNHYAFVSLYCKKKPSNANKYFNGQIRMVDLNKSCLVGGPLAETEQPEIITLSKSGEFFGIPNNRKLRIWKVPDKEYKYDEVKKIRLHHTKSLTTLAFHPTLSIIAGGDVTGRILLWRKFGKRTFSGKGEIEMAKCKDDKPGVRDGDDADSCSTWHWHPSAVKFLSFSSDGAYLYSGGKEGVLVVWQLDTGKRRFLPRIGSPLSFFADSLDPTIVAISCTDNQIHLLKMPTMEILKTIAGIKPPCTLPEVYERVHSDVTCSPITGLAALYTQTYCVQLYSLFDDRELSQVQVLERNYQPVDNVTIVLTQLALSLDASKMATVEVKLPEEDIGRLVSLKFWASLSCSGDFTLSTVIYEPHSEAGISSVVFHPARSMVVSASSGGDFKIWVHNSDSPHKSQRLGWVCQSVGSYKKRPMTAAAFSADGSVLAVAAEFVVTLWDPETNVLVSVVGETLTPIQVLSFVGESEFLVSLSRDSKPQLTVWNLSKLSIFWSYKLLCEAVACTSDISQFAVLALSPHTCKQFEQNDTMLENEDGIILLFSAEDVIPLSVWSVKKAKGGGLSFLHAKAMTSSGVDGNRRGPGEMLVYINGAHEYVIFDPNNNEGHQAGPISQVAKINTEEETGKFGYASIYGELPEMDTGRANVVPVPFVPSGRPWETVFSGSSHVLPPLSKLCSAFLASLLEKRSDVEG